MNILKFFRPKLLDLSPGTRVNTAWGPGVIVSGNLVISLDKKGKKIVEVRK